MIAVSSFRPFDQCHEDIGKNQMAAKQSWDRVFNRIIYLNDPEPWLEGDNTEFVPCQQPPRIKMMVEKCASLTGWSCIINADIIVADHFTKMELRLKSVEALCATSQRYQFDNGDPRRARTVDLGLDFFAATQSVWGAVALAIPEAFVTGKILWDHWLNNFLAEMFSHAYYDVTKERCIFHPKHQHRGDQSMHIEPDHYMQYNRWARNTLVVDSGL